MIMAQERTILKGQAQLDEMVAFVRRAAEDGRPAAGRVGIAAGPPPRAAPLLALCPADGVPASARGPSQAE